MKLLRARHATFKEHDPFSMLLTAESYGPGEIYVRVYRLAPNGMAELEASEQADTLLQAVHIWDTWIMNNQHLTMVD